MLDKGQEGQPSQQFDSSIQVPDRQYTKRRRHKAINDARERVNDVVLKVEELLLSRKMTNPEARRATARAVESCIREILWLLQTHPDGESYLKAEPLGQMRLPVPKDATAGKFTCNLGQTPHEFPVIQFRGLQSLLEVPEKITGQVTIQQDKPIQGTTTETKTVSQFIPREVSMRAYELLVEFLGKADFGIDFDDERPLIQVTPEEAEETPTGVYPMTESDLLKKNKKLTVSGDNDHLIVISASSRTPISGTGKSTLAATMAKRLDTSPDGFDAEEKATFSVSELTYDMLDGVQEGSALIYDEAQGTPSGTGLNSRRAMKQSSIDAVNGLLANRDKNLTVIIVGQQLNMLDTSLYGKIDSWILIRKGVEDRSGPLATHHELHTNDYDLGNPSPKSPALEDLTWNALPDDDPDYATIEEMKQSAKQRNSDEDDEPTELPDDQQAEIAQEYRDIGKSLLWIDENVDAITYSREWIRQQTEKQSKEVEADD